MLPCCSAEGDHSAGTNLGVAGLLQLVSQLARGDGVRVAQQRKCLTRHAGWPLCLGLLSRMCIAECHHGCVLLLQPCRRQLAVGYIQAAANWQQSSIGSKPKNGINSIFTGVYLCLRLTLGLDIAVAPLNAQDVLDVSHAGQLNTV